jgi:hypothetical protein
MWRKAVAVSAAVAAVLSAPPAALTRPHANGIVPRGLKQCGEVIGAPWATTTRRGNLWSVEVKVPGSCTTARRWVPRLTREHRKPLLGPAGYTCIRHAAATAAHGGTCSSAQGVFYWSIPQIKNENR